jgi:hypothetical protein
MAGKTKASPLGDKRPTLIVPLKISPKIRARYNAILEIKSESKSASPTTLQTIPASTNSPAENASVSNGNTPAPSGTDDSIAMPPPPEGVKKGKGVAKRTSAQADGLLKPRGKPGPKKRKL